MSDNTTAQLGITGKMPEYLSRLRFNGPAGAPIVTLTPQGKVILSEGANVDDAARVFWAAVERMFQNDLRSAKERIADLERTLDHAQRSSREHQDAVCTKEARIAELEAIFAASHDTLAQRDNRIAELEAQHHATQRALVDLFSAGQLAHLGLANWYAWQEAITKHSENISGATNAVLAVVAQADGKEAQP